MSDWPESIRDEAHLDELLARPGPGLADALSRLDGDLMILGIAGKMGVSLGELAANALREAGVRKTLYGVSRFSDAAVPDRLRRAGVTPISCDLLDRAAVSSLPRAANVVFLAGRKFGTEGSQELTWAMNVLAPANVAEHFRGSRIVALSTGCVYPLVAPAQGGCSEGVAPAPVGEYAQSCLGRERVFEYHSRRDGTPVVLIRLNYANDLRYGVLRDIAEPVWNGRPVNVTVPAFNCIWQGDANRTILQAFALCRTPPEVLNVTGPETLTVREAAEELGRLLGRPVRLVGSPGPTAYLNDAARAHRLFGPPRVSAAQLIRWTAAWVAAGGRSLNRPTHFEVADGKF